MILRFCVVLGIAALLAACTDNTDPIATTESAQSEPASSTSTATTSSTTPVTSAPTTVQPTTSTTEAPALDSEPIEVGPLEPRGGHSVVWTGEEVIVWGGEADERGRDLFSDGAAYSPDTGEWRSLPDAPLDPRRYHVAAWTGAEMLVVGGVGEADGAAYRPASDSWRTISAPPIPVNGPLGVGIEGLIGSAWTGSELVVWHVESDKVAAYDPASDQWRELPDTMMEVDNGALRWGGDALYAFGATISDYPSTNELSTARLVEGEWESLPPVDFSTDDYLIGAQAQFTAWAGDRVLAWSDSGREGATMGFDPATDTWSRADDVPTAPCDGNGEPISTATQVFAFGWCDGNVASFDIDSQTWTTAAHGGYPTARYTVWTGNELINWGDPCCYGTGGAPLTVEAWSLSLFD